MSSSFHLVHSRPNLKRLLPWAQRQGLVADRGQGDLGYAFHAALKAAFGDLAPQPFSYRAGHGLLAYSAQAQALQQRPVLSRDEALRTLQSLSQPLGKQLELTVQGERVSVQIKAMPAQALAQWLNQARTQAQALPQEAHWVRQSGTQWDGTLVLRLPSASASSKGSAP